MIMGDDGSPQVAPGYDGIKPENGQMFDCTEMEEGLFNCTVVDTLSSKNDTLVTSDIDQIKTHLENTGGVSEAVTTDTPPQPEAPAGSVVTETPPTTTSTSTTSSTTTLTTSSTTSLPSTPDTRTTEATTEEEEEEEESVTDKPLSKLTYKEACGRTPWLDEVFRASQASPRSGRKIGGESKFWRQFTRKGKIVNGEKAEYGEWPWQVSLRQWRTATFLHKCGAALLSENWAITAAHCVESVNPDELLLRMGEFDLNDEEHEPFTFQDRKVQIVASHPKFDPKTFEYDLALLRFYEPVEFAPNVIPICIPESDTDLVGETAWVTGWGRLYEER